MSVYGLLPQERTSCRINLDTGRVNEVLCWALYFANVVRQQARDRNYIACLFK